jgi:ferredoxin
MNYLVEIDTAACSAHGDCADVAPDVFAIEDTAVVVGSAPDEDLLAAAQACPTAAIMILDANTRDLIYP